MTPPPRGVNRISHGNFFVGNKTPAKGLNVVRSFRSHSHSFNEATNIVDRIERMAGFHDLQPFGFRAPRYANDCITIVRRRGIQIRHFNMTEACGPVGKWGPRTFSSIAYVNPRFDKRPIAHVNIHPHPVNHGPKPGSLLETEYIKSMNALSSILMYHHLLGHHIVVVGDFNITQANARTNKFIDPYHIANSFKLNAKGIGIDGLLWSKSLRLVDFTTIPKGRTTGADHPWFVADFRKA